MRVAILSAMETMSGGLPTPRGFARIGGRSVLQRQLDFALKAGCERIACISNDLPSELIDLQHSAEKNGAKFQIIRDIRPLSGLVNASDEILLIADGLAFDPDLISEAMGEGRNILILPAEDAVPLGFERVDRETAWAGILLASGSLVEKLADLPFDVDPQSSLLRLALQAGTRTVPINRAALFDHRWMLIDNDDKADRFEAQWLRGASSPATLFSPIRAAADRAAFAVLRRHSRPERAARIVEGVSVTLLLVAAALTYFTYSVAGLLVTALAGFAGQFSGTLLSMLMTNSSRSRTRAIWSVFRPVLIDLLLLALIVVSVPSRHAADAFFAAFIMIGLIRLIEMPKITIFSKNMRELLADRATLSLFLAGGMIFGNIIILLQVFAALSLLSVLVWFYWPRLTQA
ncbi:hypothetical protein [Pontixanthobacter gangjinensis]|uniref:Uncharacterized protein n=1 Tax=Pontixanthobacter gangjinensis TaxID=1028742 RepID=A0A6I4SPB1_9SPHN|nr:hypothetical protein [Pontixanthobacter gangjinensis]MXO56916.1 hypothetical protein [Pontixanthobacter gangjinensis]